MSFNYPERAFDGSAVVPTTPHPGAGRYRGGRKRAVELTFVLLTSGVTLPLVLALATLVLILDRATPFFRQRRVGRNGRVFHMLKIRTMVADADARLAAHLAADPAARHEWDTDQKLKHDPRVTPLGRLLRRSSLDELPQLWNVLRGEMALIGPRPILVEQQRLYTGTAYYALRPGITGLWQICARNQTSFAERGHFDTEYWHRQSFALDLAIAWRTLGAMIGGTGC